jgi:hypothetical protein
MQSIYKERTKAVHCAAKLHKLYWRIVKGNIKVRLLYTKTAEIINNPG